MRRVPASAAHCPAASSARTALAEISSGVTAKAEHLAERRRAAQGVDVDAPARRDLGYAVPAGRSRHARVASAPRYAPDRTIARHSCQVGSPANASAPTSRISGCVRAEFSAHFAQGVDRVRRRVAAQFALVELQARLPGQRRAQQRDALRRTGNRRRAMRRHVRRHQAHFGIERFGRLPRRRADGALCTGSNVPPRMAMGSCWAWHARRHGRDVGPGDAIPHAAARSPTIRRSSSQPGIAAAAALAEPVDTRRPRTRQRSQCPRLGTRERLAIHAFARRPDAFGAKRRRRGCCRRRPVAPAICS